MTTNWSAIYDFVLPELPGIETALVDHHTRQIAIDFFEETQVWIVDMDVMNLVANTATYALTAPASYTTPPAASTADPVQIRIMWINGQKMTPTSLDELNEKPTDWTLDTDQYPKGYFQQTQDTFTVYPIPLNSATGGIKAKIALRPSLTAPGIPDWLFTKYVQELALGVKGALMDMVNKPWSSLQGAQKYTTLYEAAKTKATIEGLRSFTRTTAQIQLARTA